MLAGLALAQADVVMTIVQALLSFFKLFIATFLLWLITDLFVLKALARSEARLAEVRR